jgi:pimeloyl-ACP methyl ester carboxylesterase
LATLASATFAPAAYAEGVAPEAAAEKVVLLHGLGRTKYSMQPLAYRLRRDGFDARMFGYASMTNGISELAEDLGRFVDRLTEDEQETVHFVGHSLGGLVIRRYLKDAPRLRGRVVMLSPPNGGSELVDRMRRFSWFQMQFGPAALVLGTSEKDLPASLGPVEFPLGVIMGTRSINPIGSWIIPGPDDGAVSVDRSRVEGMSEFCLVPRTHTFIMWAADVAELTGHFLRYGHFSTGCAHLETFEEAVPAS